MARLQPIAPIQPHIVRMIRASVGASLRDMGRLLHTTGTRWRRYETGDLKFPFRLAGIVPHVLYKQGQYSLDQLVYAYDAAALESVLAGDDDAMTERLALNAVKRLAPSVVRDGMLLVEWQAPTPGEVYKLRKGLGLTQRQAAERAGVSTITWMLWEGGKRNMSEASWLKVKTLIDA